MSIVAERREVPESARMESGVDPVIIERGGPNQHIPPPNTPERGARLQKRRREKARILYERGKVPLAIGAVLGLGMETVARYLREGGIEPSGYLTLSDVPNEKVRKWDELEGDTRERILVLRRAGIVPLAIAAVLDKSPSTVANDLRDLHREGLLDPVPSYLSRE